MPPASFPGVTPQDIPLEQSERVDFTPASLKDVPSAPVFVLRSPTRRDERHHRRLIREEGIVRHPEESIRAEIFTALKALWSPEDYDQHAPRIREYFEALDAYRLQLADDPDLTFEWDGEEAIQRVVSDAVRTWPELRRMTADNAEANEMQAPLIAAVIVESWTGLATRRELDRGYLTTGCAESLIADLGAFEKANEKKHKLKAGTAALELFVAAMNRLYLSDEEVGNSASPSPSPSPPTSSPAKKGRGRSKASASSPATPEVV